MNNKHRPKAQLLEDLRVLQNRIAELEALEVKHTRAEAELRKRRHELSRFNKSHGYREGWIFSTRFSHALLRLVELSRDLRDKTDGPQEQKDRDLFMYV